MSPLELVVVMSVVANAILTGFVVLDVRRLLVQHHAGLTARHAEEERRLDQESRRAELRAARAEEKTARNERATAEREVKRRRKAAHDEQQRRSDVAAREARRKAKTELEAERYQRLEAILLVMLTHVRHMDPELPDEEQPLPPSQPRVMGQKITLRSTADAADEPDSERGRPTADLGVVSSPAPSRGPSQAILPPPPAPPRTAPPPSDDAALRAAGLQKGAGSTRPPPHRPPVPIQRTRSDTHPSIPSPLVRDRGAEVPVVDLSTQERPSFEELTVVSDRGMDLRLQVAEAGPLVPMRFEARAPESPARKPEAR